MEVNRRKFLGVVSAAGLGVATGSIPSIVSAQTPEVTLRFSSSQVGDPSSAHFVWYQKFADNLKKAVGDRIKVEYFPNNQLGKESDIVQQVKAGSVDMMITGSSIWATVAPEIGMLDLGYMFDSNTHLSRALDGGVGAELSKILQQKTGVQFISWAYHFGARSVYTKNPVKNLADVKGVKLRVLPAPAFIETFKIMGAIPTPIPFNELYTALQTGVVDGFEHDPGTVIATKLYEVSKNCWLTEHLFSPLTVAIGKRGLDKMSPDLRTAFFKAASDATSYERGAAEQKTRSSLEDLTKLGVVFTPMSKSDREFVRKEMESKLWASFAKEYPATKPLFKAISDARK